MLRPSPERPYAEFVPQLNKLRTALPGGPGGDTAPPSSARLRTALTVFFALDGFLFAGWVVRIPAIKQQTGASASTLGLALLGVSAGAVITMMLTGRLCRRYGSHAVTTVCGVLLPLSIALPAQTHSALSLGLVLLVFGAAYGGMNVAMNSAAVDLVAELRRPVMPSFHAAFSLGGMVGAGLGGLVAGASPRPPTSSCWPGPDCSSPPSPGPPCCGTARPPPLRAPSTGERRSSGCRPGPAVSSCSSA